MIVDPAVQEMIHRVSLEMELTELLTPEEANTLAIYALSAILRQRRECKIRIPAGVVEGGFEQIGFRRMDNGDMIIRIVPEEE